MEHEKNTSSPRLVRTTHTEDGTSIFAPDTHPESFKPFGPNAVGFTIFDVRQSVPVNNLDPVPTFSQTLPRCSPEGALFCLSEMPPGSGQGAPMHRTHSIDYAVVLSGEIVLSLDGGEEKTIKAGEVIVQQGVNHRWNNRGDVPCRMLFVMIGAQKIQLKDGAILEEDVFVKRPGA